MSFVSAHAFTGNNTSIVVTTSRIASSFSMRSIYWFIGALAVIEACCLAYKILSMTLAKKYLLSMAKRSVNYLSMFSISYCVHLWLMDAYLMAVIWTIIFLISSFISLINKQHGQRLQDEYNTPNATAPGYEGEDCTSTHEPPSYEESQRAAGRTPNEETTEPSDKISCLLDSVSGIFSNLLLRILAEWLEQRREHRTTIQIRTNTPDDDSNRQRTNRSEPARGNVTGTGRAPSMEPESSFGSF